jgi:NAD(P)-dependent dehydrogenase (short-subunit alcohol dehydrogenase family)
VVTGAGSGIGRATSVALARRGCSVAVVDVDRDGAEQTADLVRAAGSRSSVHLVDVRDASRVDELPGEVADALGACHILVNNAGVTAAGTFEDDTLDDLRWIVDINVWGVVHGCRAFLPMLREADEAHIVNMSSMVGLLGLPHNVSYSLTKGAVRAFSEALRAELVTTNVGVTVMFPGAIRTDITNRARGSHAAQLASMGQSRLAPLAMRPPSVVARRIVKAIDHDRARMTVGPDARVVDLLTRAVPGRSGLVGRLTNRLG